MKRALLLALAIIFLFSFVLAGCGAKTPVTPIDTTTPEATKIAEVTSTPEATKTPDATAAVVEYKESPFLAGKGLPPVKDRLPKEPKITNEMPADILTYEVGIYGGTMRTVTSAIEWDADVFVGNDEALLNSPGMLGKEITGNVLKGYEMSTDQKEFTFHMREGLKWSDGTPVTAKDVQFTVDDVIFNKELTPIFPAWMCSGGTATGTPLKFTMVDDYTYKMAFDKPYGGFAIRIAIKGWVGYTEFLKPSAYLKKFHKKYNKDTVALEAAIKAAKFKPGEWVNLFNDKDILNWELTSSKSIGFPRLYPWLYTKKTETTAEFDRNPYYFKVDIEGNQLPYIDKIISSYVQDMEVVNMKMISGEVDFARESASTSKMPLYKENEAKSGYKVYMVNNGGVPTEVLLNLTFKNENWRKVVQDDRFRKALRMGINDKEIIDTIYFGFAEPSTIEDNTFDLVAANKLLDEMGMAKGTDGFRKGPDGKKFTIPFEVFAAAADFVPLTELFVEQWKLLGLDVTMKKIDSALWGTRNGANELQATVMWRSSQWYEGDWIQSIWGPLWATYFNSAGKQGEKPPADIQKFYDLIAKTTTDKPVDAMAAAELLDAQLREHNWYFSYLSNSLTPLLVNSKIANIPDKGFRNAANASMEQFFYTK